MSLMEKLGGEKRGEYEDFTKRFDQGAPWDGIDDDEARSRYEEVSGQLSDDDYELSAQEAFQRLDPDQRRELARMMRQQGREKGVSFDEYDDDDDERDRDPQHLARMARKARKKQPNGLAGLLGGVMGGGGGGGNPMGGMLGKAALGGIAATAIKRMM